MRELKKTSKKIISLVLTMCMLVGLVPMAAAAENVSDTLTAAMTEAKTYIDTLTINNSKNDPATVVSNFGAHFTWDNEDRENSKSYLFDWSYYNGVVFEGLEYVYEQTEEKVYADYVEEYMSSLIASNGTWAKCSNNSSKECAGYNSTHGADCYKTASLLLDMYERTDDSRYLTMAKTLYADLDTAAKSYSLANAGNNYRHTWSSDPTPDLWLDGLYMILPFRAEYAKYSGDTEELDLIVDRMQWVSDNMYDEDKGLFYHAADSASSNSGTFWLRAIGWYAAAIADIMDSMEGENLEAMKAQLVKLVDGMKACQNSSNGMWLNNMAASKSSTNPYETSGTALVCYAVMKAVNEGWLDSSYADMAILAFEGICEEKLDGETLTDICFKGAPGSGNSTFYDNEGKGVGPFIMFYAEMLEYIDELDDEESETPVEPETPEVTVEDTTIKVENVTNLTGTTVAEGDKTVIEEKKYTNFVAYDITATITEGAKAVVSIPVPAEWNAREDELVGISVEDGEVKEIKGTLSEDGIYSFEVEHFSAKGVAHLKGETIVTYELATSLEDGEEYLIVNRNTSGTGTALGSSAAGVNITVGSNNIITEPGNAIVWTADGSGEHWSFLNSGKYLGYTQGGGWQEYSYSLNTNSNSNRVWTVSNGTVKINLPSNWFGGNKDYFIVPGSTWSMSEENSGIYFYKKVETTSTGSEVEFTLDPTEVELKAGRTQQLTTEVKVANTIATSANISWTTSNAKVAEVDGNGLVTAVGTGEAIITATLTKANDKDLTEPIVLTATITVSDKEVTAWDLTGNDDITIIEGQIPDFSKLVLTLTYDNDSTDTETIEYGDLTVSGYDINTVGTQVCKVSYKGVEYGTVKLIVNAKQVIDTKLLNSTITVVEGVEPSYSNVKYTISYDNGISETFTVANGLTIDTANYKDEIGSYTLPVSYNGTVIGNVKVNVEENALASAVVNGNTAQTINKNAIPDYSGISLVLTYKDGTTQTIGHDALTFKGLNPNAVGTYTVDISYQEEEYGTVQVTVVDSTYDGKTEATEYPTYPEDGAVRIKKTADQNLIEDTGVARVELDVAGVSVKKAVDVVLVADISNSMAWYVGASGDGDANKIATGTQTTKWDELQKSAETFIDVFLGDTENTSNTVSFVTFGGYDKERNNNASNYGSYADSVQTHFTSYTNGEIAKDIINQLEIRGEKSGTTVTYTITGMNQGNGAAQGGTNYDYAFLETAAAINQIKTEYAANNDGASYDESNREIYVLFLTDGAPDHYNQLYYKTRSNSQFDYYALYKNATDTLLNNEYFDINNKPNYANLIQRQVPNGYYLPSANLSRENWIDWIQKDSLYAAEQVAAIKGVNSITSIGFDMQNGGFGGWTFDTEILGNVLTNLAGPDSCEVFLTDDAAELKAFYEKMARDILYAGTNAVTTDIVDSEFTVQLFPTTGAADGNRQGVLGFDPTITITAYDLYTKADTTNTALIGTRTGTSSELEKISFTYTTEETEDGKIESTLTGATSTAKEGNILKMNADGSMKIEGAYFTYYRTADSIETFEWNIGNITDKEVALSYYAYLEGSMEGTRAKGKYYTNDGATLEYLDINGHYAKKEYPMPAVVWGGAVTGYEFYLVNDDGKPCDRQGNEIPFANRIIITGPYYQDLYLNDDQVYYCKIEAAKVLPVGYTLYDGTAYYEVKPASGSLDGELYISDPATGKAQTTIEVGDGSPNYIQSHVAFGVMFNEIPDVADFSLTPDQIVIDYGKPIEIDTMSNNTEVPSDYTSTLVGFTAFTEGVDLSKTYSAIAHKESLSGMFGTFSINNDGKVLYTPSNMVNQVDKIFGVVKIAKGEDEYFMVDRLYVIPATTMYYETNFANIFKLDNVKNGNKIEWSTKTDDTIADSPQDDGTIGKDKTYGFDSTYNNDGQLSNASSLFVEGQGIKLKDTATSYTQAQFSFTGTGFDIISRTGAAQGAIRVDIYSDSNRTTKVKSVTVLNKSESNLELYQIPVVSVNDLQQGTYYVNIGVNAAYTNTTYPQLNRGGEFYFDAIRVYNPTAEKIATDAYRADGEYNMSLIEVRNQLISANDYDLTTETPGVTFVDNVYSGKDEDGEAGNVVIGTYSSIGPNNEVYLAKGQAIAFKISWTGVAPMSIDIGAKTITDGSDNFARMKAFISGTATRPEDEVVNEEIKTATAQFYNLVNADNASDFSSTKEAYVFVTNEGEKLLSITDIKAGFGNIANAVGEVSVLSNAKTLAFARASMEAASTVVEEPEVLSVTTDKDLYKVNDAVVTTITTNSATSYVTVNDEMITEFEEDGDTRVWTVSSKAEEKGALSFAVIAYNEAEEESEEVVKEVEVVNFIPKKFELSLNKEEVIVGEKIKATVTTSTDTKYVRINGKKITKYKSSKSKGTRTWVYEVKAKKTGEMTFEAAAYDKNGKKSQVISATAIAKKFEPNQFDISMSKKYVKKGQKYTVTVTTSTDVKYVKVNGRKLTKYTYSKSNKTRTFKVTYKALSTGNKRAKVYAYNKNGAASALKIEE